jgi:hypothetical protein
MVLEYENNISFKKMGLHPSTQWFIISWMNNFLAVGSENTVAWSGAQGPPNLRMYVTGVKLNIIFMKRNRKYRMCVCVEYTTVDGIVSMLRHVHVNYGDLSLHKSGKRIDNNTS